VETQGFRFKSKLFLQVCDHAKHRLFLCSLKKILAAIEVADCFKHERARARVSIEPFGARRRLVPTTACPNRAVGRDGNMLRDVGPTLRLGVKLPHRNDGGESLVLRMVRPPGVVHVDGLDPAFEWKCLE
jgi:hypothetical protein